MTLTYKQTDLGWSLRLVVALVVRQWCLLRVGDRAQPVKEIAEFPREVPRGPRFGLDLVDLLRGDLRGPVGDVDDVRVRELRTRSIPAIPDIFLLQTLRARRLLRSCCFLV